MTDYDLSDICDDCGSPGCLGTCTDDLWLDPEWDSDPYLWVDARPAATPTGDDTP